MVALLARFYRCLMARLCPHPHYARHHPTLGAIRLLDDSLDDPTDPTSPATIVVWENHRGFWN